MASAQPTVGSWYRLEGGATFEIVAIDDDEGTIEVQYFDGTVEEMDFEDWELLCEERGLASTGAPEDWSGSVDVEPDEDGSRSDPNADERDMRASPLEGLDIFEAR
ncbi:MAG TPA: DUF6763 family protein [Steroidobacteraceae bacterium]